MSETPDTPISIPTFSPKVQAPYAVSFPITATPISLSCATRNDVRILRQGEKEEPFTVSDVLDESFRGMSGWVSGYIVGSVRLGVNEVKDAADVILSDKAEMDNNLLIAASPDEKRLAEDGGCRAPAGNRLPYLRQPCGQSRSLWQEVILVNGTLSTFLGMPGVTRVSGSLDSFEIDGNSITPEPPVPPAPGEVPARKVTVREASPYNIGAVLAATLPWPTSGRRDT